MAMQSLVAFARCGLCIIMRRKRTVAGHMRKMSADSKRFIAVAMSLVVFNGFVYTWYTGGIRMVTAMASVYFFFFIMPLLAAAAFVRLFPNRQEPVRNVDAEMMPQP